MHINVEIKHGYNVCEFGNIKIGDYFYNTNGMLFHRISPSIKNVFGGDFNAVDVYNSGRSYFKSTDMVYPVNSVTIRIE